MANDFELCIWDLVGYFMTPDFSYIYVDYKIIFYGSWHIKISIQIHIHIIIFFYNSKLICPKKYVDVFSLTLIEAEFIIGYIEYDWGKSE